MKARGWTGVCLWESTGLAGGLHVGHEKRGIKEDSWVFGLRNGVDHSDVIYQDGGDLSREQVSKGNPESFSNCVSLRCL